MTDPSAKPASDINTLDINTIDTNNIVETNNGLYQWDSARLLEATTSVKGKWELALQPPPNLHATRIATDTRRIQTGDLFLALSGDNFDGHHFLETAKQKGAVAAIVSQPNPDITLPQLVVEDTRLALGQLAHYRRGQHHNLKVIAITGSSGKTSVKEMLRSIFAPLAPTLITRGNLNNDLGVPMMLLELEDSHRYAILELGANHVGEIAYTTDIVRPDVACILNIGTAHLGEFGGRDNIAKTKAEIYHTLNNTKGNGNNTAVIPLEDDYFTTLYNLASKHTHTIIGFGGQQHQDNVINNHFSAHLYAANIHSDAMQNEFDLCVAGDSDSLQPNCEPLNCQPLNCEPLALASEHIVLPLAGRHNISNALAAAACAHALGIQLADIVNGLANAAPAKGRLQWVGFGTHRIIDDTYNANPHSVKVGAEVLAAQHDYKILILGDIGELGDAAKIEHQGLGRYIANQSIDALLCVGAYAEDTVNAALNAGMDKAHAFNNKSDLLSQLRQLIATQETDAKTCTLLFKGSRSMTMETLITDLRSA